MTWVRPGMAPGEMGPQGLAEFRDLAKLPEFLYRAPAKSGSFF